MNQQVFCHCGQTQNDVLDPLMTRIFLHISNRLYVLGLNAFSIVQKGKLESHTYHNSFFHDEQMPNDP